MLISTKGRYALRVLIDMAEHQSDGYVPLKEIAQRQDISEKYMETIIKTLSPVACLEAGAAPCTRMSFCRTFDLWKGLDNVIHEYLERFTIADLMDMDEPGNDYII